MKAFGLIGLLISLAIAGWLSVKQLKPEGEDSKSTAERAIHSTKRMQGKVQLTAAAAAIRTFKAMEGRLPDNLEELEELDYIDRAPSGIEYDSETGEVWLE
jgi:hypothetical protein